MILLSACTSGTDTNPAQLPVKSPPSITLTLDVSALHTQTRTATEQVTPTLTPSETSAPPTASSTPTLSPTPTNTLAPLDTFNSKLLRTGVSPQSYIEDTCSYLEKRWSPDNSLPGTVVVPIMFHSIYKDGRSVDDPKEISVSEFENFISSARSLGFETLTTQQLYDFLDHNAAIPPRSMIMIVDDRRPGLIQERFLPVLDQYDWTVTAAYIADPHSLDWAWKLMDQLFATGRVDIQSHGYSGQVYIVASTTNDEIHAEIDRSTVVLEERYGVRPIAFIWPGGNFTDLAVKIARQDGYQLGFTAYSRGPLMFNWIPLGEEERSIGDPLMLLPRAWSNSAAFNLEQAVEMSQQAGEFARENFPEEALWYSTVCGGELTPPVGMDIEASP